MAPFTGLKHKSIMFPSIASTPSFRHNLFLNHIHIPPMPLKPIGLLSTWDTSESEDRRIARKLKQEIDWLLNGRDEDG